MGPNIDDVEIEGAYALKLSDAHEYRASEHEFEFKIIDYHDRPENFHRAWAVFALGDMKGVMALWSVETDSKPRHSTPPPRYTNGQTNGHDNGYLSASRQWITVPNIWGHSFQIGDVLRFHWRGCTRPDAASGSVDRLSTILSDTAARLIGDINSHSPNQPPEFKHGMCYIRMVNHNVVRVDWEEDHQVRYFDGQRLPGSLGELRNTRPLELKDQYGMGWEDMAPALGQPNS